MTDAQSEAMRALDEAIQVCGKTVAAFALAISTAELPVSQGKVSMWRSRKSVPAEYVPAIYRETKRRGTPVACERFQPCVDWAVLRDRGVVSNSFPAFAASEHAAAGDRRRVSMWTVPGGKRETDPGVLPERKTTDVPRGTKPTQCDVDPYVIGATARKPARRASTERPGGKRERRG
jgi:DNA-binding transcriptional regulator YdaS (Cro superfamily)